MQSTACTNSYAKLLATKAFQKTTTNGNQYKAYKDNKGCKEIKVNGAPLVPPVNVVLLVHKETKASASTLDYGTKTMTTQKGHLSNGTTNYGTWSAATQVSANKVNLVLQAALLKPSGNKVSKVYKVSKVPLVTLVHKVNAVLLE